MKTNVRQGNWLYGNLFDFVKSPLTFIRDTAELGDTVQFRIGPYRAFLFRRPEDVHEILVSQASKFYKDVLMKRSGRKFVGNGLVLNDGASHKQQRKQMQAAFYHSRLADYAKIVVEQTQKGVEGWHEGNTLEFDTGIAEIMLHIVARTLFNLEIPSDMEAIHDAMSDFHDVFSKELRSPLLTLLPDWLPTAHKRKLRRSVQVLDRIVWRMIDERRADMQADRDLLSTLLTAYEPGNERLTRQLRDEVITLFIAGHETTADLLTWIMYLLALHPEVEEKLRSEINSVLQGRAPDFNDLPQLKYTEMVIKETLRLYPPAWMITRQAVEDVTIGDTRLSRGDLVYLSSFVVQRDARYFNDAEAFDPERFAEEGERAFQPGAYFPFGGGPRICIGQSFAMMETALCLAVIVPVISLHLVQPKTVELFGSITLRPHQHITMQVERHAEPQQLAVSH